MRNKAFLLVISSVVFGAIGLAVYLRGAIDFIPRLRASANSPDGRWTVRVYQQRLVAGPLFPRMGAVARVYDRNEGLVFENIIFDDDDWDDELGGSFNTILFEGEEIRIGPGVYDPKQFFVIKTDDLKESH